MDFLMELELELPVLAHELEAGPKLAFSGVFFSVREPETP
jgi:hypothetical protein